MGEDELDALMAEGYRELADESLDWANVTIAAQFAALNETEIWRIEEDGKA